MRSNLALFHYLITVTPSVQLTSNLYSLATCQLNLFMFIRERFRGPDSKGDSDDGKWQYHICEKVKLIIWLIEGHSVTGNKNVFLFDWIKCIKCAGMLLEFTGSFL